MKASYAAAEMASRRRAGLLAAGRRFATETVFSDPLKRALVDEARSHGYAVIVMDVGVETPGPSVERVRGRKGEGGHDVPQTRLCERYVRGQPLVREAVLRADRGMVLDNSKLNVGPAQLLMFQNGRLMQASPLLPAWVVSAYKDDLLI